MNNIINDNDDDYFNRSKFILESIYLLLCQNIYTNKPLKYDSNFLFLSCIPDFISNNEIYFINHKKKNI